MAPARSLYEIFAGLTGTAAAHEAGDVLHHGGHADLPAPLLGEALVSYADTAPIEVAEHMAPFVTAHTGFAADAEAADPAAALDQLAAAPPLSIGPDEQWQEAIAPTAGGAEPTVDPGEAEPGLDAAFGSGGAPADLPGTIDPMPAATPEPTPADQPAELADPASAELAEPWLDLGDLHTDLAADLDDPDGDVADPSWG